MQIEQTEPVTTEDQQTEATIASTSDARETPSSRPQRNRGIVDYAEPPEPRIKPGAVRGGRTSQHPIPTERTTKQQQNDKKWYQQYDKMVAFHHENGHCIVPKRYQPDKSLAHWVNRQRNFPHNYKMPQDRIDLLNALGFVWNVQDHEWHTHYEKLVKFQRENGHCIVPNMFKQDKAFGTWIAAQRGMKDTMSQDRKALLAKLDFVWNPEHRKWSLQYQKMVDFKRKNGHCLVPAEYAQDKSLGHWVHTQRKLHIANNVPQKRKDLLNDLGFVWKVRNRSSPTNVVRDLVVGSFSGFLVRYFGFSLFFILLTIAWCRISIRNRSPAVMWVFQTKHQKKRNQH